MMEIVRGRTWQQYHTVMDTPEGPLTDFTSYTAFKSQIRGKTATRNVKGIFEHPLVVEVTISESNSVLAQSLTRAQTELLAPGDYLIDITALDPFNRDVSLLDPEVIRVVNRPTQPA